jgi:hypothetical protein
VPALQAPTGAGLLESGLALVGTVDSVSRQLEALVERLPTRWLFAWTYNGLIPHLDLLASIEALASQVLPRVSDLEAPAQGGMFGERA